MTSEPTLPSRGSAGVNDENPWPGLDAFAEGDCEYFCGRGQETAGLLQQVMAAIQTLRAIQLSTQKGEPVTVADVRGAI
jgi:hypothetical protein